MAFGDSTMTNWAELNDAYGSAEDVPELLASAGLSSADVDADAWDELWGRLCHQGTVYSASYAALPHLAVMARQQGAVRYSQPVQLAAAIIASNDNGLADEEIAHIHRAYRDELLTLKRIAEHSLALPEVREDATSFIYLLQAVLAFEGDLTWGRQLGGLADQEFQCSCPACDQHLYLTMAAPNFFASADYRDGTGTPLVAQHPAQLDGVAARLHRAATDSGHANVARQLTYLFGRGTCPSCRHEFSVADAVAGLS